MFLNFLKRRWFSGKPLVITRKHHHLSRKNISQNALKVLYHLRSEGYQAYLVGGGVRDMLLGFEPKDFDVVTDATPEQVRSIFRNSRLIGRRFLLVHVYFRDEIIEVSTFRANSEDPIDDSDTDNRDNTFGTIEEDAWRRDFTVNALYYNIADLSVVDYTQGMHDLNKRVIRMIGDPTQRFHEDPVRLLRAVRLSAKLNFKIHHETKVPLLNLVHLLKNVAPSRLFDEMLKLFFTGYALATYHSLVKTGYFQALFPHVWKAIEFNKKQQKLLELAMQATDQRFAEKMSLNPGFLLSILLWPVIQVILNEKNEEKLSFRLHYAIQKVLKLQNKALMIPKRFTEMMRSIWTLQYHLEYSRKNRIEKILEHRYFRAAHDFLKLRAQSGENLREIADRWQRLRDSFQRGE